MAKSSALGIAMISAVLAMAPIMVRSNSLKQITLYATLIDRGADANLILVAGPPTTNGSSFGELSVFDLPLQQSLVKSDSQRVGSLQGIFVRSSIDGTRAYISDSVIIERGKYKVGSLQVQGTLKVSSSSGYSGELGVPSGTVGYRFVTGYMEVQTVRQVPATSTFILLLKIFYKEIDD